MQVQLLLNYQKFRRRLRNIDVFHHMTVGFKKGSAGMRCSFHYYHTQLILVKFLVARDFISLSYISFLSLLCFNQFLIGIVQRSCAPEQDPRYQWHYPLHAAPYMFRREPPFHWALAVDQAEGSPSGNAWGLLRWQRNQDWRLNQTVEGRNQVLLPGLLVASVERLTIRMAQHCLVHWQ